MPGEQLNAWGMIVDGTPSTLAILLVLAVFSLASWAIIFWKYFQFRKFLRRSESLPKVFWMDRGNLGSDVSLSIFFRNWSGTKRYWSGQVRYLNPSTNRWVDVDEIDHGYVVLDRTRAKDFFNNATPQYFISPKQTWRVVFESRDGRVLVLDPASRVDRAD